MSNRSGCLNTGKISQDSNPSIFSRGSTDTTASQSAKNKFVRKSIYYVYIVQCSDGTYYTGYTNNLESRINRHNAGFASKYTRARLPVCLVWKKDYRYFKPAFKAEQRIKQLTRKQKTKLIDGMRLYKVLLDAGK